MPYGGREEFKKGQKCVTYYLNGPLVVSDEQFKGIVNMIDIL